MGVLQYMGWKWVKGEKWVMIWDGFVREEEVGCGGWRGVVVLMVLMMLKEEWKG